MRDYAIISEQQSISRYLNTILGGSDVMNASSQQNAVLLHEDRPTPTPSDNKADKRMKLRMGNNNDSHTRSHSGSSKSSHTSACADYLNGENNLLHDKEIGGRKIKRSRKQSVKRKQARAKDDRKRKEEAQKRKRKYLLLLLFIIAVSVYLFIDDSNFLPSSVYQRNEITQSSQSSLPSSNIGDDGNGRSADTDTAFQTDGKGAGDAGNFMGDSVIGGFNVDASQTQPLALPLFMMLSNYFWNLPKHLLHLYYDLDGNNTGTRTSTQVQTMSELFSYIPSVSMYLSVRSTEQDSVSAIWSTCAGREPERKAEAGAEVEMGEGGVQLEGRGKDDDEDAGKVSSSDGDDKAGDNVELNEGDEHKYGLKYRDDFVHIHTEARGNVNEIVARETTTGEDGNANRHIISGEEMGRHIGNCDNIVDDELMYSESDDKIEERRINTKDASSSPETSMPSPPLPLPPSSSYFTVEYIMKTVFAIITFSLTLGFVVVYTLFEDSFLGSSSATSSFSSPSSLVFTTPEPAVTAVPFAPPLSPASMHRSLQRQTTMTNDEDAAGTLEQNHTMVTHAITKTSESKVDTHSSIIHTQGEDARHVKEEVNSNTEADTTTKAPYVFKLSRCLEYLRKEFQEHNKNITNHQSDKNHSAGEKANDVIENAENIISQLRARWMMLETQGAFTTNNNRISMRRIKEITYTNTIKQKKSADINIGYGDDDDIPEGFASEAQLQHVVWRRYCREKMIRYKNHKRTLNNEGRSFGNQIDKGKGEGDSNKKQRSKKSTVSKPKLDPNKPPSPFPANLQIIVDDVWINTEMHVRAPLSFSTSVSSTRLIHFWDFARFVVEDIEGVNGYNIAGLQKQNIPKHFLP